MAFSACQNQTAKTVSLFTREWIEMLALQTISGTHTGSPSLRGSGLKSFVEQTQTNANKSLPLYEGVD